MIVFGKSFFFSFSLGTSEKAAGTWEAEECHHRLEKDLCRNAPCTGTVDVGDEVIGGATPALREGCVLSC